jgi:hypothetical protein
MKAGPVLFEERVTGADHLLCIFDGFIAYTLSEFGVI